ncbi:MAG: YceI family protein [Acetobacteraceae bacterium]|nr:YceI family protein [Acetobacteraceae bacterium]
MRGLRTGRLLLLVLCLGAQPPGRAASLYHIDQRHGTIEFSVGILGMFSVQGRFPRFQGDLLLDTEHPERSHVDVAIDTNAIEMPLSEQTDLLRSAAYFDTAHFPQGRFVSGPIQALSPSRYLIHGTLWIRGIAQPQDLDAVIQDRHTDMARRIEVADFVVTGRIRRSAFGMVADRIMVSDTVRITIRIHLEVGLAPDGG